MVPAGPPSYGSPKPPPAQPRSPPSPGGVRSRAVRSGRGWSAPARPLPRSGAASKSRAGRAAALPPPPPLPPPRGERRGLAARSRLQARKDPYGPAFSKRPARSSRCRRRRSLRKCIPPAPRQPLAAPGGRRRPEAGGRDKGAARGGGGVAPGRACAVPQFPVPSGGCGVCTALRLSRWS